jgi:anti-sigma B factor antagonist
MTGYVHDPGLVVVRLPAEMDIANAGFVSDLLYGARTPGTTVVVADLTSTLFCDSSGFGGILAGQRRLAADGAVLRVAVPPGNLRRTLQLLGLDAVLSVFPSVAAAIEG